MYNPCLYSHACNKCTGPYPGFKCGERPSNESSHASKQSHKSSKSKHYNDRTVSLPTPISVDNLEVALTSTGHPGAQFVAQFCNKLSIISFHAKNLPTALANPSTVSTNLEKGKGNLLIPHGYLHPRKETALADSKVGVIVGWVVISLILKDMDAY